MIFAGVEGVNMPEQSYLDGTAFSCLDDGGQEAVRLLFEKTYQSGGKLSLETLPLFAKEGEGTRISPSLESRRSLAHLLDFYSQKLPKMNLASFRFLTPAMRGAQKQDLMYTFYLLSAQILIDKIEDRCQDLQRRANEITQCAKLIRELRKSALPRTPESILVESIDDDAEKCLKYLGLTMVAPLVVDGMEAISSGDQQEVDAWMAAGQTASLKKGMGEVNAVRLYWVWAGNFLSSVLSQLPENYVNKQQAQQAVAAPGPITGYMSWVLYYTRFGVNLLLVAKHTVPGWWMSDDEQKIPIWERFTTQLDLRKFTLLNDSVWATGNMACFLWLCGEGRPGYLGNVLTAVLLLMDVSLTIWRFVEESTQYAIEKQRFIKDIELLEAKIRLAEEGADDKLAQRLRHDMDNLIKAQAHCNFEYKYKWYGLVNDLTYATGLLLAFTLMCGFLLPGGALAPEVIMLLSLSGAALCFLLTAISEAVTGYIDVAKTTEGKRLAREECSVLLEQFKTEKNPSIKKLLYLEMMQLMADSDYHAQLAHYQKVKVLRSFIIELLVPPLIFVSFTCLPFSFGMAAFSAGVILGSLTNKLVDALFPELAPLPKLGKIKGDEDDESAYEAFLASAQSLDCLKTTAQSPQAISRGFFDRKTDKRGASGLSDDEVLDEPTL